MASKQEVMVALLTRLEDTSLTPEEFNEYLRRLKAIDFWERVE